MGPLTPHVRVPKSDALNYIDSPMIRVLVGKEEVRKEFNVHQDLICSRSNVFMNALKKPWIESEERKVTLGEEEPETFSLYLKLLYSNKLLTYEAASECKHPTEYSIMCKFYVLAEMPLDDTTKEVILQLITEKAKEADEKGTMYVPGYRCIDIIYARTQPGNPARALLAQLWGDRQHNISKRAADEWPKDFLYDYAVRLRAHCARPKRAHSADYNLDVAPPKKQRRDLGQNHN